ncbi:hypothetical protein [Rhodovibrio sodomensis]|uniref:hypothetical protein n=1 Tax=Rhodovibrio sodomensis TaxID=1088 RepID=UPI001905F2C1|nr:hypothetical protein [Rhodovibrio sodomensis]
MQLASGQPLESSQQTSEAGVGNLDVAPEFAGLTGEEVQAKLTRNRAARAEQDPVYGLQSRMIAAAKANPGSVEGLVNDLEEIGRTNPGSRLGHAAQMLILTVRQIGRPRGTA